MISLRYGGIPIVRRTGGLADTITDYDPRTGDGNGFSFGRYHQMDFFAAIVRAVEHYREPERWRTLQVRGMQSDNSWSASAQRYVEVFEKSIEFRRGGRVAV
jgi:starch synthase